LNILPNEGFLIEEPGSKALTITLAIGDKRFNLGEDLGFNLRAKEPFVDRYVGNGERHSVDMLQSDVNDLRADTCQRWIEKRHQVLSN
jgi:hypothetical protein